MGGCREGCSPSSPCGVAGCPDSGVEIGVDNTTTGVLDFDVAGNIVTGGRGRARIWSGNDAGGGVHARVYGNSVVDASGGVDIAVDNASGGDSIIDVRDNTVRGVGGAGSAIRVSVDSEIAVENVAGGDSRVQICDGEVRIGGRGRSVSFGSGNRAGGRGSVFFGSGNRRGDDGDPSSEIRIAAANRARGSFQAIVSGNDVEVYGDGDGGSGVGIGVGNEAGGNIRIELTGNRIRTAARRSSTLNIGSGNRAGGDIVVKASGNSFRH